jgi:hypothetical protein
LSRLRKRNYFQDQFHEWYKLETGRQGFHIHTLLQYKIVMKEFTLFCCRC